MSKQMMAQNMATLRSAMAGFLDRVGTALRPAPAAPADEVGARQRLFLIGNTFGILEQLRQPAAVAEEVAEALAFWRPKVAEHGARPPPPRARALSLSLLLCLNVACASRIASAACLSRVPNSNCDSSSMTIALTLPACECRSLARRR